MAREPEVPAGYPVRVASPHKAIALVLAGHVIAPSHSCIELDGNAVAWFVRTPALLADISLYNTMQPLFAGSKRRGESVSLEELRAVIEKARQQ